MSPRTLQAFGDCRLRDFLETGEAFVDGAVGVAFGKTLGGRAEHHDFIGAGGDRGLQSLHVRHQHRIGHAGLAPDARHDFGVVGHLRHPLGRHECGGFDDGHAGILQPVDQFDFGGGRYRCGFVLQAVARADFEYAYFFG